MGKRAELDEYEIYLYTPIQNMTVEVQLSNFWGDWMRWSMCLDVSDQYTMTSNYQRAVVVTGLSAESSSLFLVN